MPLSKQRVAELINQVDPSAGVDPNLFGDGNNWTQFSRFLELVEEDAVSGRGSWVRRDDVQKHVMDLDAVLNPTQARSALAKDPDLIDVVAQAIPVLQASRVEIKEVNLLREVYENARSFLRFNGIDQGRAGEAVDRMDIAIEKVKQFDGGQLEDY